MINKNCINQNYNALYLKFGTRNNEFPHILEKILFKEVASRFNISSYYFPRSDQSNYCIQQGIPVALRVDRKEIILLP